MQLNRLGSFFSRVTDHIKQIIGRTRENMTVRLKTELLDADKSQVSKLLINIFFFVNLFLALSYKRG